MPQLGAALVLGVLLLGGGSLEQLKPLTNADIVRMVKAGLAAEIIVASIGSSDPQFDVSPDALIALKRDGVPDNVVHAMVARPRPAAPGAQAPGAYPSLLGQTLPTSGMDVSLIDGSTRVHLRLATQGARTSGKPLPFARHNVLATFRGSRADVRSSTGLVSLRFVLPADRQSRDVLLVKLDEKDDRREIKLGGGRMSVSIEFDKDDLIETTIHEAAPDAGTSASGRPFTMNPVKPLRPGEYAVVFNTMFYDFGVNKPDDK